MIDLAEQTPRGHAARDALIWVIAKTYHSDAGAYGDQLARAARLLVKDYANDPAVACLGLSLDSQVSRHHDAFLEGIYANAEDHEAKGLARLALGPYLAKKVAWIRFARSGKDTYITEWEGVDEAGNRVIKTVRGSNEHITSQKSLRLLDPEVIQSEAERRLQEVIAAYGDLPYASCSLHEMMARLKATPPETVADSKKKAELLEIQATLAEQTTLGKVAQSKLDLIRNFNVGQAAPAIDGTPLDGKPMRLADHRGKVVVLVFWASACGPWLVDAPNESYHVECYPKCS